MLKFRRKLPTKQGVFQGVVHSSLPKRYFPFALSLAPYECIQETRQSQGRATGARPVVVYLSRLVLIEQYL